MLQKIILFITLFVSFFLPESYANDLVVSDSTKTIRELKENIEWLDKAKEELYLKIKDFAPDQKLKSYFRDDLTLIDLENMRVIIDLYNKNKLNLEIQLQEKSKQLIDTSDIKKSLLEEKKELYKKLTSFIKTSEYSNYLEYIKSDTTIYFERKEIDSDIYRKQEILNTKVNILEEKIKEHRTYIEESLQKLVEWKMDEKLELLKQNKNFSVLKNTQKIEVIEKTIIKTQSLIKSYEDDSSNTLNNNKKIEVYKIVLAKLQDFKNSFK